MNITPGAVIPDWGELEAAFEADPMMMRCFLDRTSGEVVFLMEDRSVDPDGWEEVTAMLEAEPERFEEIEPIGSREGFMWMERFVETVGDARLVGRLEGALGGSKPFRRFKDVLLGTSERERWFAFERGRRRRYVVAWLEENGIAVGAAPPWPELEEEQGPSDGELQSLAERG